MPILPDQKLMCPDQNLNLADLQPPTGLRQRQLCELMGWDYRQVAQTAKQQGMSTHVYVQQQTGWVLHLELYYPKA